MFLLLILYNIIPSVCSEAKKLEGKISKLKSSNIDQESIDTPSSQPSGFQMESLFKNVSRNHKYFVCWSNTIFFLEYWFNFLYSFLLEPAIINSQMECES